MHIVTNKNQHDTHTTRLDTFERMNVYEQMKEWNEEMYERVNRTVKLNANRVYIRYDTYNTLYIATEHWYYNVLTTRTVVTIFELIFFKAHAYISIQMCLHV